MAKRKNSKKKVTKKTPGKVDFTKHLNEGLEDPQFPNQQATMQGFFKDVGDEIGLLSSPASTDKPDFGMLVFVGFVVAAFIISIGAIV